MEAVGDDADGSRSVSEDQLRRGDGQIQREDAE
jgi:hypothetical protein